MLVWSQFGFSQNIFDSSPIPPSDQGERLLVGRAKEIKQIHARITSSAKHVTIEGANGVGKTSLVGVALHKLQQRYHGHGSNSYFYLCEHFQLYDNVEVADFRRRVFFRIGQRLIEIGHDIQANLKRTSKLSDLQNWLNDPTFMAVGTSMAGFGGSVAKTPNLGAGFEQVGYEKLVRDILREAFGSGAGGIICVIDNLELLENSSKARSLLENLRDDILSQTGLKWVLCGARGIVRSVASSQRLSGRIANPLEVDDISAQSLGKIIDVRKQEFRICDDAYVPVSETGFRHIAKICNFNLRTALSLAEEFAIWLWENDDFPQNDKDKDNLLEIWLCEEADKFLSASARVRDTSWALFELICDTGGLIRPSDHQQFGYKDPQSITNHSKSLKECQLIQSEESEQDRRIKHLVVTPKGWLVYYRRRNYFYRCQ